MIRTLRAEELARDVEGLAADDNDLLAVEELLGDDAGQAAKQVALAIDHDLFRILSALPHLFQLSPRPDHAIRQLVRSRCLNSRSHRDLGRPAPAGAAHQLGEERANVPQTRTKTFCRGDLG